MNPNPVKLFISYAHADEDLKQAFTEHLSGLKDMGLVDTWDDRKIMPGEIWDKKIKTALETANIVVFLISAKFSASRYIHDVEIKNALENHEIRQQKIISILVRPFLFDTIPGLNKFQTLPKNATPVTSWNNQNEAWVDVTKGIRKVIEKIGKGHMPVKDLDIEKQITENEQSNQEQSKVGFKEKTLLEEHHKYICDRVKQAGIFKVYYNSRNKEKRIHFFYFYGGDLQAHSGLFQRFVGRLKGRNDPSEAFTDPGYQVRPYKIQFPKESSVQALKVEVMHKLMKKVGLTEKQIDNLEPKNLQSAIKESPHLNALAAEDKVCVHISIPETNWEADTTPEITKWMIEDFCLEGISNDTPEFFLFFSIEYEEENTRIRKEIDEALENAKYTVGLPELGMVERSDIDDWFTQCSGLWEKKTDFKRVQKKWKKEFEEEMYMEDVQDLLEKIIESINNPEKNANRNS